MLHVARLKRLELTEEEVERLTVQLGDPRGGREGRRARSLGRAADLAPAFDLVVWGEDVPHESLPLADALANAPEREGDLFRVPPTV